MQQTRLEELVAPICQAHAVRLVEVRLTRERNGAVLRVLIEREAAGDEPVYRSGVDLADCSAVSHDISAALDVHDDLLPSAFHLEVGSPGIERPLLQPEDFDRFAQKAVFLRTFAPIDGQRNFRGILLGRDGEQVRLQCESGEVSVPAAGIAKAHLVMPTSSKVSA